MMTGLLVYCLHRPEAVVVCGKKPFSSGSQYDKSQKEAFFPKSFHRHIILLHFGYISGSAYLAV